MATYVPASAQVADTGSAAAKQSDEVVQMSAFEVTTTKGHGYVATNSASAFKSTEQLLDIPQQDTVISQDLIQDINSVNSTDIVSYFGATSGYANSENMKLRGTIITYAYIDEMPANSIFEDNSWVDTYEIIKGPAEILYLNSSLNGVVLKSTKKPLPFAQNIATLSVNSNGLMRGTFDSSSPGGTIGDARISYRVVGADQRGGAYFKNYQKDDDSIYTIVQLDWKHTTARFAFTFENLLTYQTFGLVTPGGDLWTGNGFKNSANVAPNSELSWQHHRYLGEVLTRISDNWEQKVKFCVWRLSRYTKGSETYFVNYDWANKQETFTTRQDDFRYAHWCFIDDIEGHYMWGPFKNIDILGGGYDEYTIRQQLCSGTSLPSSVWTNQIFSMYDPNGANSIVVPRWQTYDYYISQGYFQNSMSHNTTPLFNLFWSHEIAIIPDRLIVTGGWSYTGITPTTVTNANSVPWTATIVPQQEWLHRYGITLKVTKDISLFALESTNFAPATQGAVLAGGNLAPPQSGKDDEFGFKTAFFGGKLSMDFSHFKMTTANYIISTGNFPNGLPIYQLVGTTVEEGEDGDLSYALVPGWQVIGSFYVGHDRDPYNRPVSASYDNSWSLFTRYDFQKDSPLRGWAIGTGFVRVGGRWVTTSGVLNAVWTPAQTWGGVIEMKTGNSWNGFVSYKVDKHWSAKFDCMNILGEKWPLGLQTMLISDPSPPRTFTFETDYRF